ncbi:hypothetical protein CBM2633_A140097 [Cupriavidus taiwanensis]|nr:hypothetical protein CBM2626_A250097 [Cupriavidus taiwanensis]SPA12760.1 hypothetical protein CBM2633_A140097 [Cupriavidus taiwanensis]
MSNRDGPAPRAARRPAIGTCFPSTHTANLSICGTAMSERLKPVVTCPNSRPNHRPCLSPTPASGAPPPSSVPMKKPAIACARCASSICTPWSTWW